MALSTKGLRKIEVNNEEFFWKVRSKVSHDETHDTQLGIPIQHKSNGRLLVAYIGYCRSQGYGRETQKSITPSTIRELIITAIDLGWNYSEKGKPLSLVDGKLMLDTKTAKYKSR